MKLPGLDPNVQRLRFPGAVVTFYDKKRQTWIVRSWPRSHGKDSPKRKAARELFALAVHMAKFSCGEDVDASIFYSRGSPFLPRDLRIAAMYGRILEWSTTTGKQYFSRRVMEKEMQALLNTITDASGAMIVNGPSGWGYLLPGDPADTLNIDPATGLPAWGPTSFDVQAALDEISTDIGVLLYRSSTGWVALEPGTIGDVLISNGAGAAPSWLTGGGGGGGQPATAYWDFKLSGSWCIVQPDWFTANNAAPSSNWVTVVSSQPKSAGAFYAEVKLQNLGSANPGIGIFPNGGLLGTFVGDTSNGWCIAASGQVFAGSGGSATNGAAYAVGDVIGIAIDFSAGTIDFYKNGGLNGGVAGASFSGLYRLAFSAINYPVMATLSTTLSACAYSPPSGFNYWN